MTKLPPFKITKNSTTPQGAIQDRQEPFTYTYTRSDMNDFILSKTENDILYNSVIETINSNVKLIINGKTRKIPDSKFSANRQNSGIVLYETFSMVALNPSTSPYSIDTLFRCEVISYGTYDRDTQEVNPISSPGTYTFNTSDFNQGSFTVNSDGTRTLSIVIPQRSAETISGKFTVQLVGQ